MYKITKNLILLFSFLLTSCYDDLTPVEYGQINVSDFPKTEDDVKGLVTAAYDPFNGKWKHLFDTKEAGYQIMSDLMGAVIDVRWTDRSKNFYGDYGFHVYHPQSTLVTLFFNEHYSQLNSGTLTLDRIDRVKGIVSDEKLDKYRAEVRLARGWMSFIYYDWFGPMPIIPLEALKDPLVDRVYPRATFTEYVKYIEDDLKFAAEKLDYIQPVAGKFYKGLANMLLLKLYMIEKDWANVKNMAEELMKPEYGYSLSPGGYDYPFSLLGGVTDPEVIYYVPTEHSDVAGGNGWHTFGLHPLYKTKNPNIEKWGILMGTWYLYDSYNPADTRTKRMITELTSDSILYNRENPSDIFNRGPFFMKYAEDPGQGGAVSAVGICVYRFADVLLAWAEAENNLKSGPTAECWNKLNMVRDRSNAGILNQNNYSTLETFNDLILAERLREFPVEGLSRQDLIRNGQFNAHTRAVLGADASNLDKLIDTDGIHDKPGIEARYNYRLPIPNTAIRDGKGLIIQNPGYN